MIIAGSTGIYLVLNIEKDRKIYKNEIGETLEELKKFDLNSDTIIGTKYETDKGVVGVISKEGGAYVTVQKEGFPIQDFDITPLGINGTPDPEGLKILMEGFELVARDSTAIEKDFQKIK